MSTDQDRQLSGGAQLEQFMKASKAIERGIGAIDNFSRDDPSSDINPLAMDILCMSQADVFAQVEATRSAMDAIEPWLQVIAGLGSAREVAELSMLGMRVVCATWHGAAFQAGRLRDVG